MTTAAYELAQVNIGRPLAPLDSAQLAGFVAALEPINALADAAPGFVWRLQSDGAGDATGISVFGDGAFIVNMSVWRDLEALGEFVFRSGHVGVMRQRRSWFAQLADAYSAMWWVPSGVVPTVADAEERLLHIREHGSTPFAFTFRVPFPAPDAAEAGAGELSRPADRSGTSDDRSRISDDWSCPV
jgi:hypothetical protein